MPFTLRLWTLAEGLEDMSYSGLAILDRYTICSKRDTGDRIFCVDYRVTMTTPSIRPMRSKRSMKKPTRGASSRTPKCQPIPHHSSTCDQRGRHARSAGTIDGTFSLMISLLSLLVFQAGVLIERSPAQPQSETPHRATPSIVHAAQPSTSTLLESSRPARIVPRVRGRLDRRAVDEVVQGGIPKLLAQARITPARHRGQFIGFRLARLTPQALALRAGFREGDVIMMVNGEPIGRPDQMMHALSLLPFAPRLTIRFKRAGVVRDWIWEINS